MKKQKEYIANYLRETQEIVEQQTKESRNSGPGNAAPDITSQASREQLRKLEEEQRGETREITEDSGRRSDERNAP